MVNIIYLNIYFHKDDVDYFHNYELEKNKKIYIFNNIDAIIINIKYKNFNYKNL